MIVKGNLRGVKGLATHLNDLKHGNEIVEVVQMRDVHALDLAGALDEMACIAKSRKRCLYHGVFRTQSQDYLGLEQAILLTDEMERALGIEGHQLIMVRHRKADADGNVSDHYHIVWGAYHPETLKPMDDGWNYAKHLKLSCWAVKEFGLSPMPEKRKRPPMDHSEWRVSDRMKSLTKAQVRDFSLASLGISRAVPAEQRIEALAGELAANGLVLAKGDKIVRGLPTPMVVDPDGQFHALGRQVGLKVQQLDLGQMNGLPTVAQAKILQEDNPDLVLSVGAEWRASQWPARGHVQP